MFTGGTAGIGYAGEYTKYSPAEIVAIVSALEDLSIPAVPEGDHSIVVGVRRGAGEA